MKTPRGSPRRLTDRQVREVLKWHQEAIEFQRVHGTRKRLALLLGVSVHAVRGCLENPLPSTPNGEDLQVSTARRGRPRHLSRAQITFVIAWRNAGQPFYARHGSVADLARALGVGATTVHDCIRRKGRYAQGARADLLETRRCSRSHPPMSDDAWRSALLRSWRREKPAR
jgi:hypothetical protein